MPSCIAAFVKELSYLAELLEQRTRERFVGCSAVESAGSGEGEVDLGRTLSIDTGDVAVFYSCLTCLDCLNALMEQSGDRQLNEILGDRSSSGSGKNAANNNKGGVPSEIIDIVIRMMRGIMGSDAYLLTSLACGAKLAFIYRPYCKECLPGFPPLLQIIYVVQETLTAHRPREYFDALVVKIEQSCTDLRTTLDDHHALVSKLGLKKRAQRNGTDMFKDFLKSISGRAADLCAYTDDTEGDEHSTQIVSSYCKVLRELMFLTYLLVGFEEAFLQLLRTVALAKNKRAETYQFLFGPEVLGDEKSLKASKKPTGLARIHAAIFSSGMFCSGVRELVEVVSDGRLEIAMKERAGEADLNFKLLCISDR